VELGGCNGGQINAVTNLYIDVDVTLLGTNSTEAITFNNNGNTIYFSGECTGPGGFNLIGGGTMEISSSNNSSAGDIFVNEGTLRLSADDALTNAIVYVASGATLDLGGHNQTIGGVRSSGSVINGTYNPTRYNQGTVIIFR
jgi:autotransporter-associated beta strand protein